MKKISKIALLVAMTYSSSGIFAATPEYDVAGAFSSIPANERMGRAAAWLGRVGQNTTGTRDFANAVPSLILAAFKKDSDKVAQIINGLKAISDDDKNFLANELATAAGLADSIGQATLKKTLENYRTVVTGGVSTDLAIDVLATLGLFPKMNNAVEYWNNFVGARTVPTLLESINSIPLLLLFAVTGKADLAAQAVAQRGDFTDVEKTLMKEIINTAKGVLTTSPNPIRYSSLETLSNKFLADLESAITGATVPATVNVAPAEVAAAIGEVTGVSNAERDAILEAFVGANDVAKKEALKEINAKELAVLKAALQKKPEAVLEILDVYVSNDDLPFNEELAKEMAESPAFIVLALTKNETGLSFSAEGVPTEPATNQKFYDVVVSKMTPENVNIFLAQWRTNYSGDLLKKMNLNGTGLMNAIRLARGL